jgi:outer membrane protein OmpA-like peptidoglycan-associated protein
VPRIVGVVGVVIVVTVASWVQACGHAARDADATVAAGGQIATGAPPVSPAASLATMPPPFCGAAKPLVRRYAGPAWAGPPAGSLGDTVPMVVGLMVTTAIAAPEGDYESIKVISGQSDDGTTVSYTADAPDTAALPDPDDVMRQNTPRERYATRVVLAEDQQSGCGYAHAFHTNTTPPPPDTMPGGTAITVSAAMRASIDSGHDEYLELIDHPSDLADFGDTGVWIHLASRRPVPFAVLLNGRPVTLPAMHAVCDADSSTVSDHEGDVTVVVDAPCDLFVLDDAKDPLVLAYRFAKLGYDVDSTSPTGVRRRMQNGVWQLDTADRLRVIKIDDVGPATTERQMEDALAGHRKVLVYGICFDFASADIKRASDPVLREIADLLHRNPTWTLAINGYTDSIGGDAYNLALSARRAAAVKDTLVSGYHIAARRLTTAGYGAASPVDSNATLEGRARNRRVELVR